MTGALRACFEHLTASAGLVSEKRSKRLGLMHVMWTTIGLDWKLSGTQVARADRSAIAEMARFSVFTMGADATPIPTSAARYKPSRRSCRYCGAGIRVSDVSRIAAVE